jgi:hypothetical protein
LRFRCCFILKLNILVFGWLQFCCGFAGLKEISPTSRQVSSNITVELPVSAFTEEHSVPLILQMKAIACVAPKALAPHAASAHAASASPQHPDDAGAAASSPAEHPDWRWPGNGELVVLPLAVLLPLTHSQVLECFGIPDDGGDYAEGVLGRMRRLQNLRHRSLLAFSLTGRHLATDEVMEGWTDRLSDERKGPMLPTPPQSLLTLYLRGGAPTAVNRASIGAAAAASAHVFDHHPMPDAMPGLEWMQPGYARNWTLSKDRAVELSQRHDLYVKFKQILRDGKGVWFRSSGWSLYPRVYSNDLTIYEPVISPDQVTEGDIVFCEVQPGNVCCARVCDKRRDSDASQWCFAVSNATRRTTDLCHMEHIYGRMTECRH